MIEQQPPEAPDWAVDQPQDSPDDQPPGSVQAAVPDWASDEQAMAPGEQPAPAQDQVPDWARDEPAPDGEWSPAGSLAAGAVKGAVPTAGGLAAGLYAGGLATVASAPVLGPAAPVAGIIAGLGVGMGASWLLDMGQDKFLALLGADKPFDAARQANPTAFDVGTMLPATALLRPNLKSLDLAARGIGAGIGVAAETGMQAVHGEFDPKKIGMAGAFGAALPRTNVLGSKVLAQGEAVGARYRGGNKNPDLKTIPEEEATTGRPDEPAPQQEDITVNNDQEMVAAGVALEQGPVPETIGAGNPVGSPGAQRVAAKPSDPARNYQKDQPATHPDTVESKVIDTEPLKGDIKAALQEETPGAVPRPEGTDVLPTPEAAPTTRPLSEDGTLEMSRLARNAENNVAQKMASEQKGELFEGLPRQESPDVAPSRPEPNPEQAPKAAGPLSPAEARALAEDRQILTKAGWDRALAALDQRTPREQHEFLIETKAANAARQELATGEGKKVSEAEARRPDGELRKESRQKVSTGVLASSKGDAARKEAAIAHVKSIYDEFGPQSEKGKMVDPLNADSVKNIRAFTKQVWDEAVKRNRGRDPLVRASGENAQYVPIQKGEHSDAYQWLKAVKASAKGQNQKNFATLHSTEGMGKLDAETGRVEGDIAHRPQVNEAGAEAEISTGAMEQSRTSFEPMKPDPRPGADNAYVENYNKLTEWVNDLYPHQYEKLAKQYELRAEMDEPADPKSLHSAMMQTLADTGKRPKGEITSEVELPGKQVKAPHLPSEVPPPAGRVIPKGSDEFKRLAAQYEASAPKGPAKPKAAQLEDLSAKERSASEAINGSTHEALIDKIKSFVGDESGAGFLHKMFSQPANPASPAAAPGVTDYVTTLSKKLRNRLADEKNTKIEIMGNLAAAADAKLTPYEHRQISLAEQDNRTGSLPQKLQDHYREFTAPVRQRAMDVMRDFKDLNDAEKLGYELPNLNAVTTKAYQPRYQIDKQHFNRKDTDVFDPFTGKGVGDWAANLEDRTFYALENRGLGGAGRMVVEITRTPGTGGNNGPPMIEATVHRGNGNVMKLKNLPASFEGKLGDVLDLTVKGQRGKWTVDQATTKEIETNTGIKSYENATWAWSRMLDDMTKAYENAKMTTEIKNDPEFRKLITTDKKVAEANKWPTKVTTHLPDFATEHGRKVYMPDNMRWVFDDYHKPGFGGLTSEGIERLRNWNTALLKVFNTNAPLVHVLNELDLFVVGRGFKWISPKAYYDMAVSAPKAFKSVNAQDHLQAEMRKAGVNPMLASVGMRTMYETAAKNFGMEVIKNHSQWDPLARTWGVSTKEVGQKLYDLSSDVTWRLSDYLTTIRYLEEKAAGHAPDVAAKRVNQFMSDYNLGTTVGIGKYQSRTIQQLLAEPAVTAFGRYKAGVFRSIGTIGRNLLSPQATKQERIDALGQLLVMGVMGYMVYPAADALVRKVTGNDEGELRRRGVSSVAEAVTKVATGTKDPVALATRAWTPAPLANTAMELVKNKDFAGKPIIPQGEWPGVIPDALANAGEYALKTAVPPYGTVSQHYARPEGNLMSGAGALLADQFGGGLPSDAAQKRAGKIEKINAQTAKSRQKRPGGVIPDLMNRLTD